MPEASPFALLEALTRAGVDFVVVGGVAVVLQASPRFTKDLDIVYADDPENLERLAEVLLAHDTRLRGAEDVPFVPDARALRQTQILTLTTTLGELDLLLRPDGAPPYADLRAAADRYDIDGVEVRVASIDDMIAMKRAAGRPQDGMDIAALEIARRER